MFSEKSYIKHTCFLHRTTCLTLEACSYYLETALCKLHETHTTHSMRAWCDHPYHHHLQVVAWKLPLPPFWLFQKQFCMCVCTINLFFFEVGGLIMDHSPPKTKAPLGT